jgi:hypothetical protein
LLGFNDVMDRSLAGKRCRTVKPIMHHTGRIPREAGGMVRYATENLGRRLLRIDLDDGQSLFLLPDDIEFEQRESRPLSVA